MPARLAKRVWFTKFQSTSLNNYQGLSGFQSSRAPTYSLPPRSEYLITLCGTEPIRYVTFHFRDRRSAPSLVTENLQKSTFLCVNRSPIGFGFRVGARAIRYSVNIPIKYSYTLVSSGIALNIALVKGKKSDGTEV